MSLWSPVIEIQGDFLFLSAKCVETPTRVAVVRDYKDEAINALGQQLSEALGIPLAATPTVWVWDGQRDAISDMLIRKYML